MSSPTTVPLGHCPECWVTRREDEPAQLAEFEVQLLPGEEWLPVCRAHLTRTQALRRSAGEPDPEVRLYGGPVDDLEDGEDEDDSGPAPERPSTGTPTKGASQQGEREPRSVRAGLELRELGAMLEDATRELARASSLVETAIGHWIGCQRAFAVVADELARRLRDRGGSA